MHVRLVHGWLVDPQVCLVGQVGGWGLGLSSHDCSLRVREQFPEQGNLAKDMSGRDCILINSPRISTRADLATPLTDAGRNNSGGAGDQILQRADS